MYCTSALQVLFAFSNWNWSSGITWPATGYLQIASRQNRATLLPPQLILSFEIRIVENDKCWQKYFPFHLFKIDRERNINFRFIKLKMTFQRFRLRLYSDDRFELALASSVVLEVSHRGCETFAQNISCFARQNHAVVRAARSVELKLKVALFGEMLSGFVCTFHPAAPGSNPKHTIYAFINLNLNLRCDMLKRWK